MVVAIFDDTFDNFSIDHEDQDQHPLRV